MKTEFEVKILDVNYPEVLARLERLGAKKLAERNMRRFVYDVNPKIRNFWIRLRDNGEKTTLTLKKILSEDIDGTKEIEFGVGDFESANHFLNELGFFPKAYQENKRLSFKLLDADIDIDFWPKIPPYVEIEADSPKSIEKVVKLLGFKMSDTTSIGVEDVYKKYGININDFKELKL